MKHTWSVSLSVLATVLVGVVLPDVQTPSGDAWRVPRTEGALRGTSSVAPACESMRSGAHLDRCS